MKWYFKINIQHGMKIQTIWDAISKIKQNQNKKMIDLIQKLKKRESESQENPTNSKIRQRIRKIQHEIKIMQTEALEKKLKMTKQIFFENANKGGR